ncbi:hypothetical protein B0H63DRAFT_550779 [Podospora didyma]|uniref:Uncharacterized protein n=1 Tax=Podospora didyma TaxID=330526 RepID=A0AAE0K9B2_9PEZI|nr:hypothetical protein B0H63DRAFT_550779 [Podospora didyma]
MSNVFDITIINKSGASQSYLLFAVAPQVSGAQGPPFSNVFLTASPIQSRSDGSSSTTFSIARQFYGICGTSNVDLSAGVTVGTTDYEAVTLGSGSTPGTTPGTTLSFTTTGGASFSEPVGAPAAPAGAYTVQTDSSFQIPTPNNTFVGLGGLSMSGKVVPMATFLASPSTTYNIYPVVKYYIATGSYAPGEIISVQSIGLTQLVDFTGSTYNSMTYIHDNNGTYSFSGQNLAKQVKLARLRNDKAAQLGAHALEPTKSTHAGSGSDDTPADKLAHELQSVFMKMLSNIEAKAHPHKGQTNGTMAC